MYVTKLEKDIRCPMEYGLDILSGKWNIRVICLLGYRKRLRFSEMRQSIPNISDAALASTLKNLIQLDIVNKEIFAEIPPRSEYFLSVKGRSITPILNALCSWSAQYFDIITDNALEQCKTCTYYMTKDDNA